MDNEGKEGSFKGVFIAMIASIFIAILWDSFPVIKNTAHAVLNPTAGALLNWNITLGMTILVFIISIFMTLIQKYGTDQETLKRMRNEQKRLNEEMKKVENSREKMMELQKESMKMAVPMMKLSMRPIVYTAIPLILFFRWFADFFSASGFSNFLFFGFLSWFWFYLIGSIIFSSILRKIMNVA